MSETLEAAKKFLAQCTDEERIILLDYLKERLPRHPLEQDWGVDSEVILSAISRSSDLTKRGVRGIIAEAIFERNVLGKLATWEAVNFVDDRPYDFLDPFDDPRTKASPYPGQTSTNEATTAHAGFTGQPPLPVRNVRR